MHGHAYAERATEGIKATSPGEREERRRTRRVRAERGPRGPSPRESGIASEQRGVISGYVAMPGEPGARVPQRCTPVPVRRRRRSPRPRRSSSSSSWGPRAPPTQRVESQSYVMLITPTAGDIGLDTD